MAEERTQVSPDIAGSSSQTEQPLSLEQGSVKDFSIGIALSGGGFRATLFHLGVIEYLRHIGRLKDIKTITSVSGGSILAAHLVLNWEKYNGTDEEFEQARNELLNFIQSDLRSYIIRRYPITLLIGSLISVIRKLGFASIAGKLAAWLPSGNTKLLADYYHKYLLQRKSLSGLEGANRPTLRILVTNLTRIGDNSFFDSDGYHVQQESGQQLNAECPLLSLGVAVAASSAFPAVFEALEITPELLSVRNVDLNPTRQFLTDGGAFDNLGLHQLLSEHTTPPFNCLIASDASGGNDIDVKTDYRWLFPRLTRVSNILYRQVNDLQKGLALHNRRLLVFDIRDVIDRDGGLSPQIQRRLEFVRTDLDTFSPQEINSILGHGYEVAKHTIEKKPDLLPPLNPNGSEKSTWQDIPDYQKLEDERLLALINQGIKRKLRLFSVQDRIVWLYVILLALMIGLLVVLMSRTILAPRVDKITETSINPFLHNPGDEFKAVLGSANKNFYFVGLTNYYTLSNHREGVADAIKRGIKVNFYLYLPKESGQIDPNQVNEETFAHYREAFDRYRPGGNDYTDALQNFWRNIDAPFSGSISSPPSKEALKENYRQFFYSDEPKAWLIVIDADEPSFTSAKKIFWFPYLAQANEVDRPGLRLTSDSPMGKETLKWLKKIVEDQGTRPAESPEIEKWKKQILSLGKGNESQAPIP